MYIIEDSRQQKGKHEIKHKDFAEMGVNLLTNVLPYGDYAYPPRVSVDTKRNMEEIAQNIGGAASEHQRFKNECIKAKECGAQLIILVENTEGISSINEVHNWINPELVYRPRAITGERLEKAMKTMSERYGVRFEFCHPEESAKRIMELLENGRE
jgi:ribosome-associated protein